MSKFRVARSAFGAIARDWKGLFVGSWRANNIKVIAYELARQRMERSPLPSSASRPESVGLGSVVCGAVDWESAWLPYWAARYGMKPALHRKLWELTYICQVLSEHGKLSLGHAGIGFGCGKEPIASILAVEGCDVLATDLGSADPRAQAWASGEQHGGSLGDVWVPELCPQDIAEKRIRYRAVDMNAIPADTHGQFDFTWSTCALEHLGSIENGLRFIVESTRCLKVGGVAVHTTEVSLEEGTYLDNYPTVIFRLEDFVRLGRQLNEAGCELVPVLPRPELPFLDEYVDVPPYRAARSSLVGSTLAMLHLRVLVASYKTTSIGLVARRIR